MLETVKSSTVLQFPTEFTHFYRWPLPHKKTATASKEIISIETAIMTNKKVKIIIIMLNKLMNYKSVCVVMRNLVRTSYLSVDNNLFS